MSNNEPKEALVKGETIVDCEVVPSDFCPDDLLVDAKTGKVVRIRGHVVGECSQLLTRPKDGAVVIGGADGSFEMHW